MGLREKVMCTLVKKQTQNYSTIECPMKKGNY